jgi:hypothetical protein
MEPEIQELEDTLKSLRPAASADDCMARLLAAVESRLPTADPALERDLARLRPAPLGGGVAERLLETVARVPFPVDEKVVLFPGATKPAAKRASRNSWIAAAAAVAVLGGFAAMMVEGPTGSRTAPVAKSDGERRSAPVGDATGFVPAALGSGVQEASDEGVMWTKDGRPMRMVRVIYNDRVKYLNERGEIIEVERPRVEYLMVPEKID